MKGVLVEPGSAVKLADFDPGYKPKWATAERLQADIEQLALYQERLAAQNVYGLLVVLQGIDASGKDGTVRHVMSGVNPQGVVVHSFKVPSTEELDHDYLWRYVQRLPQRGQIGIFNRSHYEEVLVVRVHPELLQREDLPPDGDLWQRRFREINEWERYLTDNGFRIVKLFLN
ncbi:MAG: polyphosphate kinase 2 family protein, partial [Actinomycetota bacterium]